MQDANFHLPIRIRIVILLRQTYPHGHQRESASAAIQTNPKGQGDVMI